MQAKKILTPKDHGEILHGVGQGVATVAIRQGSRWLERRLPLADLGYTLGQLADQADIFLSQNRFWNRRLITQLAEADALFADLDYYRLPDLTGAHPWHVLELALNALLEARIPSPSFAVSTGQGLALVWLHTPIPRAALPRWNACQRHIWQALKHLGADRCALDAARVLRVVGTRHSGTGTRVEALTPTGEVWSFDALADEVLPVPRAELHALAAERAKRKARGKGPRPARHLNRATYWETVLTDLQRLRQVRWFGMLPPGQRDHWLFLAANAMAWLSPPLVLRREAFALVHEVGGWDDREAQQRLSAILHRAHMAARGETVEWANHQVDPRYRFKAQTIIEWLDIREAEMREGALRVLVTPEIRREYDRERWHARQKTTGRGTGQSREEYLNQAKQRRGKARRLREQGMSWQEVGEVLGISPDAARMLVSR